MRKSLVIAFGALSLFFAVVAVLRHFEQSGSTSSDVSTYAVEWTADFRNTAEKAGKPVFLFMCADMRALKNPEALKILRKYYTVARMNVSANPADYAVLKSVYKLGGARGEPKAAILTPELVPIVIASKFPESDTAGMPALPTTLAACAKLCKTSAEQFRKTGKRIEAKLSDDASNAPDLPKILSDGTLAMHSVWSVSEIVWLMRNSKSSEIPNALLCENARLSFAMFARSPRVTNRAIAFKAAYEIVRRLQTDKRENPLFLRALASAAMVLGDRKLTATAVAIADEILKKKGKDGLFFERMHYPVSENALMASALCYVYKASGQDRFLEAAKACMDTLTKSMSESPKALAFENSQASLEEVAFCARACADIYILNREDRFRLNTTAFLNMAYENFYHDGAFRLNSNSSPLARLARPPANKDSNMPSAEGVIAQLESDRRNLKLLDEPLFTFNVSEKISELSARNLSISPFENLGKASLRLALMPNILMK